MFDGTFVVIVIVVESVFVTVDLPKHLTPILEATQCTHEPKRMSRDSDGTCQDMIRYVARRGFTPKPRTWCHDTLPFPLKNGPIPGRRDTERTCNPVHFTPIIALVDISVLELSNFIVAKTPPLSHVGE